MRYFLFLVLTLNAISVSADESFYKAGEVIQHLKDGARSGQKVFFTQSNMDPDPPEYGFINEPLRPSALKSEMLDPMSAHLREIAFKDGDLPIPRASFSSLMDTIPMEKLSYKAAELFSSMEDGSHQMLQSVDEGVRSVYYFQKGGISTLELHERFHPAQKEKLKSVFIWSQRPYSDRISFAQQLGDMGISREHVKLEFASAKHPYVLWHMLKAGAASKAEMTQSYLRNRIPIPVRAQAFITKTPAAALFAPFPWGQMERAACHIARLLRL